jgi:hypothetical protein
LERNQLHVIRKYYSRFNKIRLMTNYQVQAQRFKRFNKRPAHFFTNSGADMGSAAGADMGSAEGADMGSAAGAVVIGVVVI